MKSYFSQQKKLNKYMLICKNNFYDWLLGSRLGLNQLFPVYNCNKYTVCKGLWPLITVRANTGTYRPSYRHAIFYRTQAVLQFFYNFLNKFLHVKNWANQLNMQKIMGSIFLTMKTTIFDTHGRKSVQTNQIYSNLR